MERDYDGDSRIFRSDLRGAAEVGQSAGARAVARQGARKPPTGVFPVLYDERISSGLNWALAGGDKWNFAVTAWRDHGCRLRCMGAVLPARYILDRKPRLRPSCWRVAAI